MPLLRSFAHARDGLAHLLRTQRNFRIEVAAGGVAVAAGIWSRLDRPEWLALVLTVALVLILEAVNTAVESAVSLARPTFDPVARVAKDVSAAAVLVAAIASVVIGVVIFGPRVTAVLGY